MDSTPHEIEFPAYHFAQESGLLAYGGDLSVERLIVAYRKGIFPWFSEGDPILWWFPNPRFVLFPRDLKISKSMQKIMREQKFMITENKNFKEVVENCQKINRSGQDGTWITEELKESLLQLHPLGIAKSVEVWLDGELVGGFYGIEGKRIFCGESMFAKVSNASKAGFIYFVQKYAEHYELIDCQIHSQHLESLGAVNISAESFLTYLD